MTKIDDIFDRLQKEQPVIDMPDELTESIMNSLPDRKAEATGGQKAKRHGYLPPSVLWQQASCCC